jgi:hypothetical protein
MPEVSHTVFVHLNTNTVLEAGGEGAPRDEMCRALHSCIADLTSVVFYAMFLQQVLFGLNMILD